MNGLVGLELCRHEESESESCPERSKGSGGCGAAFIPDWWDVS